MVYLHWFAESWRSLLISGIAITVAVAVALLIHAVLFSMLRRVSARTGSVVGNSLHLHARRPGRWVFPLVVLLLVVPALPLRPELRIWLQHAIALGAIAAIAWAVMLTADIVADVITAHHRLDVRDNLEARRIRTQISVLRRVLAVVVIIVAVSIMLLTFPSVRTLGASLLASAGLAGLVVGMAMKPTLGNLVAGVQIALTQPIRLDDAVIVEGEYGWVEEINSTYVVLRLWDWRRMVLPLTYFIEHPFQNWTRTTANLIGSVYLHTDYTVPVDALRAELDRLVHSTDKWNGQVVVLQVTDTTPHTIQLRALVDAKDAGTAWDLRCLVREGLIKFMQENYPQCLPKTRAALEPIGSATDSAPALPLQPSASPRAR